MHDALLRQRFGRSRFSLRERLAVWCTVVGFTAVVITVVLCMANKVSAQQAIAMALLALMTSLGGLLALIIPDPWTAWRRGFRQGCETALNCQRNDQSSDTTTPKTRRERDKRSG